MWATSELPLLRLVSPAACQKELFMPLLTTSERFTGRDCSFPLSESRARNPSQGFLLLLLKLKTIQSTRCTHFVDSETLAPFPVLLSVFGAIFSVSQPHFPPHCLCVCVFCVLYRREDLTGASVKGALMNFRSTSNSARKTCSRPRMSKDVFVVTVCALKSRQ